MSFPVPWLVWELGHFLLRMVIQLQEDMTRICTCQFLFSNSMTVKMWDSRAYSLYWCLVPQTSKQKQQQKQNDIPSMPLGCLARPFQAGKTKVTPINHDPSRGTLSPRYDGFFPMVVYKAGICQKINWWVHRHHLFYLIWPLGLYKLGVQRCSLKTYCRCL